jgi:hypothetical protein
VSEFKFARCGIFPKFVIALYRCEILFIIVKVLTEHVDHELRFLLVIVILRRFVEEVF